MLERAQFQNNSKFLMHRIEPLKKYIMPVNPFEITSSKSNVIGIKETLRHLSDGKPLGMFPAGEFPVTKTANLWSTNHGKKELLK
jgi:putative hemolysin